MTIVKQNLKIKHQKQKRLHPGDLIWEALVSGNTTLPTELLRNCSVGGGGVDIIKLTPVNAPIDFWTFG